MFNISECKPEFGENGHKWKDNIYRAYIGPYYREMNPVGPVYLYLGIRNRDVEALSGVFDSLRCSQPVSGAWLNDSLSWEQSGRICDVCVKSFSPSCLQVFRFMCWHVSPGFIFVNYGNTYYRLWKFFRLAVFWFLQSNKGDWFGCHFVSVPSLFGGNSVLSGRLGVWLWSLPFRSE